MSWPWLIVVDCSISLSMVDSEKLESTTLWSFIAIFKILGVSQDAFDHFFSICDCISELCILLISKRIELKGWGLP